MMPPVDPFCWPNSTPQPRHAANGAAELEGVMHEGGRTQVSRHRRLVRQQGENDDIPGFEHAQPEPALARKPSGPLEAGPRDIVYASRGRLPDVDEAGLMRSIIGALKLIADQVDVDVFGDIGFMEYHNVATRLKVWASSVAGDKGFLLKFDAILAIQWLIFKEYDVSRREWEEWRFQIKRSNKICARGGIAGL